MNGLFGLLHLSTSHNMYFFNFHVSWLSISLILSRQRMAKRCGSGSGIQGYKQFVWQFNISNKSLPCLDSLWLFWLLEEYVDKYVSLVHKNHYKLIFLYINAKQVGKYQSIYFVICTLEWSIADVKQNTSAYGEATAYRIMLLIYTCVKF